jgi:hypothetical protein
MIQLQVWDVDICYDNHIDYNECLYLAPVFTWTAVCLNDTSWDSFIAG